MNISIIGTGYVGLVTGACLAEMGNRVHCVDVNEAKIKTLQEGGIPIYEPGLEEIVKRNYASGRLSFHTDLKDTIEDSDVVFCAVGTPPDEDGSADLKYVVSAARRFGELINHYTIFVTKSTVPVGTASLVYDAICEELAKRNADVEFDVASNPEFLKEGKAVSDFLNPERVVIGTDSERAKETLQTLYKPFAVNNPAKIISMSIPSAELTKYACNAMLATRISFMNEIANLCEKVGADIESVRKGMATDTRIGAKFLYAGCGYGGSCFPKDVKALIHTGMSNGEPMQILNAVENVNNAQKSVPLAKARGFLGGFEGKKILVWGLAFKPETDDIREAPALTVVESLLLEGAEVYAYDPVAGENFSQRMGGNLYHSLKKHFHLLSNKSDVEDFDALILLTEWNEFRNVDWQEFKLNHPSCGVVVDGRNIFDKQSIENAGIKYYGIGK